MGVHVTIVAMDSQQYILCVVQLNVIVDNAENRCYKELCRRQQ